MRAFLLAVTLAVGAVLALGACNPGRGRPQSAAAPRVVAGVAVDRIDGPAGRLAVSFAKASEALRPAGGPGGAVHFRMIQYSPIIENAYTPYGFAAFLQEVRDIRVLPSSAATIEVSGGPPRLTTPAERALWRAAGKPSLPHGFPSKPNAEQMPAGTFSFIPQGKTLTYRAAAALPASAAALSREIRDLLAGYTGPHPLANQMLTQLGYLLAAAPLTPAARSATWMAVATLPGLHRCPDAADLAGRRGEALCAPGQGHETELLVDPSSGAVQAVEDRLLRRSAAYPGISPGTLLESDTFTGGS